MEEIKQEHPSQIQISFSRCQSSHPVSFYGSDIGCNSYQYSEQNAPCFSYGDECEQIINP